LNKTPHPRGFLLKEGYMEIPPIPSSSPSPGSPITKLSELSTLWNSWWDHPSEATGEKLLSFMKTNEAFFDKMAANKSPPPGFPPTTPFSNYYDTAISYLQSWMAHGSNPNQTTPVSEWISDVFNWLSQ
jgi:hypothetical protein